ncbi:MAG TPA: glycosyltransferase family 1 protein [Nocardioides sp.]|jgi:glycosyltransferase involved in cell wall biosynthesis|uniref:glycosyltransferase family 4 protein n=1 Tax=Nocardioides sp. TaxID=35761 RepID=UPI002E380DF2|nr:glycosyltransferase family 1 protein [Nocardioides sp.]HEX3930709.1 glycosyltransferase family 1 protein [Nocardioides sp.]
MLHIAIDARLPEGLAGGVSQVVIGLAQGYAEHPHVKRTWVVYPGHERWLGPWLPENDDVVVHSSLVERVGMRVARRAPTLVSRLRPHVERVTRASDDRALAHWDAFLADLGADVAHLPFQDGFVTSLPSVYQPHDLQHHYLPELFTQAQLRHREVDWRARAERASQISVGTRAVKADVESFWDIAGDKIHVVPLAPVALPSSSAPLPRDRDPLVLYPAAFWPHKDHVTLVRAVGRLRQGGSRVRLVLPGAHIGEYPAIRKAVEDAGLAPSETIPGYVTAQELGALYERAWVVAVPSLFESASFPVWEGFRQGKPAVVARTTSLPDQVGAGGLVVEQRDVEGFARAIETLVSDDELAERMGEAGRHQVQALSWRRTSLATAALCRLAAGDLPRDDEAEALGGP